LFREEKIVFFYRVLLQCFSTSFIFFFYNNYSVKNAEKKKKKKEASVLMDERKVPAIGNMIRHELVLHSTFKFHTFLFSGAVTSTWWRGDGLEYETPSSRSPPQKQGNIPGIFFTLSLFNLMRPTRDPIICYSCVLEDTSLSTTCR